MKRFYAQDKPDFEIRFTHALVDMDLLVFSRCMAVESERNKAARDAGVCISELAASTEEYDQVVNNVNAALLYMQEKLQAEHMVLCFSHAHNFRHVLADDYKANRADRIPPRNLASVKARFLADPKAVIRPGLEADDVIRALQDSDEDTYATVACTIDKDFRTFPGYHYRWETVHAGELLQVITQEGYLTQKEGKKFNVEGGGDKFFAYQMLIGDATDGILGCAVRKTATWKSGAKAGQEYSKRSGVGSKAAYLALKDADNYHDLLSIVHREYKKIFGDQALAQMTAQARLLCMTPEVTDDWRYVQLWATTGVGRSQSWYDTKTQTVGPLPADAVIATSAQLREQIC